MLTDLEIRRAKPSAKKWRLTDERSLYLEIQPGGAKAWRLKYRFGGRERVLSFGRYPEVGLARARQRAQEARALLAEGIDPNDVRKAAVAKLQAASLNSLEAVARAWLAHRAVSWKTGTREAVTASLVNDVFPKLGARPIAEIRPSEIREAVQAIDARGAGETATRVLQRLQLVFKYAMAHDLLEVDPTYPLKPSEIFKPRRVKHRASLELADVPVFLARLRVYDGDPATRDALELLVLTATRPGEVRGAAAGELDLGAALWRIPGERMKMKTPHLVPLSRQALRLVKARAAIARGDDLLFPSPFYPGKPISDGTLNSALARMGYKGIATAHGFRTLFSTTANEAGWNADVIERQLAHEERNEVRGAYNRAQHLDERKRLMQWWADRLDSLRPATASAPRRQSKEKPPKPAA